MAKRGPTIARTALALIEERGPLTLDELAVEMVALGRTQAKDPVAAVRGAISYDRAFIEGRDGRLFSVATQLEGTVFTVAPTALERDSGIVLVRDDLALVRLVLQNGPRRRGHESVHVEYFGDFFKLPRLDSRIIGWDEFDRPVYDDSPMDVREAISDETANLLLGFIDELGYEREDDETALRELREDMDFAEIIHGPDGWLPALRPREVLALEIRGGTVRAVAIDKRAMKGMHLEAAVARVREIAHGILDVEGGLGAPAVSIETLLQFIATEAPDLFRRPLPPLSHLLERAGFEVEDGFVGLPGAAWDDIRWALDPDPEAAWGFEPGDALH